MLNIGDKAPDFNLPCSDGTSVSLSQFSGHPVVLFFYPRDDTPGCTTECINFSKVKDDFEATGAVLLGISKDSLHSHTKFIDKHQLSVPLLSDENGTTCEDYGVWKEKNMYGKTYMGIERSTFLIDSNGIIYQIWRKVKVAQHVENVLNTVQSSKS
ncbi:MAG: thioredoxin-dependent thiol peroxidase [Aestuariivita sp.]|nr:thioredoxin-dependent thiol peroxidase [Aestuariivita sp.]